MSDTLPRLTAISSIEVALPPEYFEPIACALAFHVNFLFIHALLVSNFARESCENFGRFPTSSGSFSLSICKLLSLLGCIALNCMHESPMVDEHRFSFWFVSYIFVGKH